jgi:hypothetical protein
MAFAQAQVFGKEGDVQRASEGATPVPVGESERIAVGATVTTGPGGKVILRFPDGLQIAMNERSALRIAEYKYRDAALAAAEDKVVLELQRGAVRVVTGTMVERSSNAFTLHGPQANILLREPADFSVALVNPMYLSVHQGIVVVSNQAGRLGLAEGSTVSIANGNAVPATLQPSALPQAAGQAFQNLQLAGVTTPGAAASGALPASAAGTAGGAGFGAAGLIAVGVGAAAIAAGASGDDEPASSSTTQH